MELSFENIAFAVGTIGAVAVAVGSFKGWKFGGKHINTTGSNSPVVSDSPGATVTVNDEPAIIKTVEKHLTVEDYTLDIDRLIAIRLNGAKCERVGFASALAQPVAAALLQRMLSTGIRFEDDFPTLCQVHIHQLNVKPEGEIALAGVRRQFMFDNPTSILIL